MKLRNRLGTLAFALTFALALLPMNVAAAQSAVAVVYLEPVEKTIGVGEEIAVQVWADDVTDLYGAQFALTFNDHVLEGLGVEPGAAFAGYPNEYEVVQSAIGSGVVEFAATLLRVPKAPPITGQAHLATVTFRGRNTGTGELAWIEIKLSDDQGQPIPFVTQRGRITVGPATMGTLLKGIAVDEARNLVYVAVQSNNTVAIVAGATHDLVNAVPCGGVAPNGLALSEDGSKLFVVNSGSDQVAVLDADNGYALLGTIGVGENPFGIAIANGIAYVTNFDGGTTTLIDVDSMAAFNTVTVGHHPSLPAATGDHAYVPNHSLYYGWRDKDPAAEWDYVQKNRGKDTGVSVVYSDGRVEHILQDYVGFFAAAVDEVNQRVYITKRDGTAEGLYVLNLVDNGLLKFVPMLRPYAVAVNPETQHVFVVQADMDEVYVLDGTDDYRMIRALNTDPNNGDIPDMHGGQGIGVLGGEVYVSNYAAGTLTVFDDPGAGFTVPLDVDYIRGWMESGGNHGPLGDPIAPAYSYWYSEQQFERGSMHWRQELMGPNSVYVFDNESPQSGGTDWTGRDSGVWQRYDDTWTPSMPLFPAGCPDAWWPYGPMFGFGVVWCDQPGVKEAIGYPIGWEFGTLGGDQSFANGKVFWNPASDAYYVLQNDNMRWQYYRAYRRYSVEEGEVNVTGSIKLQGRSDHRGVMLTSPDGPRAVTDESGSFGLNYEGQTTLEIRHPGYLDVVATIKASPDAQLNLGEVSLLGGDVNGDSRIDILDISYIGYRFSSADAQADLNGDGVVDVLDLSLVGANFGQSGPLSWQ